MKAKGLGKGLSALFSETEEDYGKSLLFEEDNVPTSEKQVNEIDIGLIFANPNQPRKVYPCFWGRFDIEYTSPHFTVSVCVVVPSEYIMVYSSGAGGSSLHPNSTKQREKTVIHSKRQAAFLSFIKIFPFINFKAIW